MIPAKKEIFKANFGSEEKPIMFICNEVKSSDMPSVKSDIPTVDDEKKPGCNIDNDKELKATIISVNEDLLSALRDPKQAKKLIDTLDQIAANIASEATNANFVMFMEELSENKLQTEDYARSIKSLLQLSGRLSILMMNIFFAEMREVMMGEEGPQFPEDDPDNIPPTEKPKVIPFNPIRNSLKE